MKAFNKNRDIRSNIFIIEIKFIWLKPSGCTKRQNLTILFLPDMHLTQRHGKVKIKRPERYIKVTQTKESRNSNMKIWKNRIQSQKHSLKENSYFILTKVKSTMKT